jgi:superfamily II DNA/RNA helicase
LQEAARVETALQRAGYNCRAIHGDQTQDVRTAALAGFKSGECPLLIATDVAARGLDIPDVEVVINFTFPLTIEDYIHRIGRTGRAGKSGISHTLFTLHDKVRAGARARTRGVGCAKAARPCAHARARRAVPRADRLLALLALCTSALARRIPQAGLRGRAAKRAPRGVAASARGPAQVWLIGQEEGAQALRRLRTKGRRAAQGCDQDYIRRRRVGAYQIQDDDISSHHRSDWRRACSPGPERVDLSD